MFKNFFYNKVKIHIKGLNLTRLLRTLKNKGITLQKINKTSYNQMSFFVPYNQKKLLTNLLNKTSYEVKINSYYGPLSIVEFFKKRIGVLIGLALFFCLVLFFNTFIWNIKIYGLEKLTKEEVISVLNAKGISVGNRYNEVDLEEVERYLESSLENISMISLMKKGSTILVNIKEVRVPSVMEANQTSENLVAKYSGVISKINVIQGTALVNVGDTVKKGDILIAGYYTKLSGEKINCQAIGEVYAKTWFDATVTFKTQKIEYVETGKKIENSYLSIKDKSFFVNQQEVNFEYFKTVASSNYLFLNNILPIKINKIIYLELEPILIEQNFDEMSDIVKEEALFLAKEKLPDGLSSTKEFTTISKNGNIILVTAFLECVTAIQE